MQFYEPDIFGIQEAKTSQVIDSTSLQQYHYFIVGRNGIGKGNHRLVIIEKRVSKYCTTIPLSFQKHLMLLLQVGMPNSIGLAPWFY